MSAQAEPRGGSGVWDFLRNLSEKQKGSSSEQMPEEHPRMRIGRYAAAVLPAALLLYYCTHAALYAGEHHTFYSCKRSDVCRVTDLFFTDRARTRTGSAVGACEPHHFMGLVFARAVCGLFFAALYECE